MDFAEEDKDIYFEEGREMQRENDEISIAEEAFMMGYSA